MNEAYLKVRCVNPSGDAMMVASWPGDGVYFWSGNIYSVGNSIVYCLCPQMPGFFNQYLAEPPKPQGFNMSERGLAAIIAIAQKPELATELLKPIDPAANAKELSMIAAEEVGGGTW